MTSLSRRGLLASVAVIAAAPLLDACGSPKAKNEGTTNQDDLSKALPAYQPSSSVKPDIPVANGVNGATTDPAFLTYPANPPKSVTGAVGSGGSYTTMTPLWARSRPPAATSTTTRSTRRSARR
ncbi:hypothetical protein GCM10020218_040820 [Dactylosporangium vinaceum]